MATANTYLKVTELDFEQIRTNLKSYLSTQDQFADFNFEGSAMATLLDVLAYNTHYNAYYLNMLANEMFLDTAQQRESVVSRAKELGYTPTSAIGATANVFVSFSGVTSGTSQFTIPKNSKFTTTIDDVTYTYVTPEAYTVINNSGSYTRNINIKEGEPLTHRFTVSTSSPVRYIIPNANVDTSSIVVSVQESSVDTTRTEFTRATNINQIYSNSPVYFLEEAADGKYEIVFSTGALGKPLQNGNIVIVDYLVCNGDSTNGAETFSIDTLSVGVSYTAASLTTNSASAGGRAAETIDSIKFNAPKNYQTQNRAVVQNDYERIILAENADIQSVVAFGGEEATPAVYGKVYIGVKPFGENFATENRKAKLKASISTRTPLGIDPVIIDPEYTYIIPTVKAYYNATSTTTSPTAIRSAVLTAIDSFSASNLERFGNRLRYSRFVRTLDNLSIGDILNTDASIQIQRRFIPTLDISQNLTFYFNNQLRTGTLSSSQFTYEGFNSFIDDDGLGNVRIYRFDSNRAKVVLESTAGTIDYTTGTVVLDGFIPSSFVDDQMKLTVTPQNLDVVPTREQILIMDSNDATVNVISEYT